MDRQAGTTTELDERRRKRRPRRLGRRLTRWLDERPTRRATAPAAGEHCGVLIVDDDRDFREALALLLEAEGIPVAEAASGREALCLLPHRAPRLIVVDADMPVMDGIEFLATKRALWRRDLRSIPVIVLAPSQAEAERAGELGAAAVLRKPLRFDSLLDRVGAEIERC
jgi:two-component system OmpR family response regulator